MTRCDATITPPGPVRGTRGGETPTPVAAVRAAMVQQQARRRARWMPPPVGGWRSGLLLLAVLPLISGCAGTATSYVDAYERALETARRQPTVAPGSAAEQAALARFTDFVAELEPTRIRRLAPQVYAPEAYLHDTLREVHGAAAITDYLAHSVQATSECRVTVADVARTDGDYYFRWTMTIRADRLADGRPTRSVGMSHIRFDAQGRVLLHQDFWDPATGLYEHLPVVGPLVRWVKRRL